MKSKNESKKEITEKNSQDKNSHSEKNPHKNPPRKVWKIIAIAFIVIFVIIIAGGVFRLFHFNKSLTPATSAEINAATEIVLNEMIQRTGNADINDYDLKVSDRIRVIERNDTTKRIIEVSVKNSTTRHMFLIDADSWQVLMHSESEFYGWMDNDFGGRTGKNGGHEEKRKLEESKKATSNTNPLYSAAAVFNRF